MLRVLLWFGAQNTRRIPQPGSRSRRGGQNRPGSKFGGGGGGNVEQIKAKAQQEIKPEAIALGVFGLFAGIAVAIGVANGIMLGRALWNAFAREIDAVLVRRVPGFAIAVIAVERSSSPTWSRPFRDG